jgi:excisionase family DNA binding protein
MKLITTADAAARLGIHQTRVQVLIREGRLPAQMLGGTYLINEDDLRLVADRRPGRPRKSESDGKAQASSKGKARAGAKQKG